MSEPPREHTFAMVLRARIAEFDRDADEGSAAGDVAGATEARTMAATLAEVLRAWTAPHSAELQGALDHAEARRQEGKR